MASSLPNILFGQRNGALPTIARAMRDLSRGEAPKNVVRAMRNLKDHVAFGPEQHKKVIAQVWKIILECLCCKGNPDKLKKHSAVRGSVGATMETRPGMFPKKTDPRDLSKTDPRRFQPPAPETKPRPPERTRPRPPTTLEVSSSGREPRHIEWGEGTRAAAQRSDTVGTRPGMFPKETDPRDMNKTDPRRFQAPESAPKPPSKTRPKHPTAELASSRKAAPRHIEWGEGTRGAVQKQDTVGTRPGMFPKDTDPRDMNKTDPRRFQPAQEDPTPPDKTIPKLEMTPEMQKACAQLLLYGLLKVVE